MMIRPVRLAFVGLAALVLAACSQTLQPPEAELERLSRLALDAPPVRTGTVLAWGFNLGGQVDVPEGLTDVIAIDAGSYHSVALRADGTVVAWGDTTMSHGAADVPTDLTDVVAIAAGRYHNLALRGNGTVVGWGSNDHGQATPPAGLTGVTAIAAGSMHSLALKHDGTVVTWGGNHFGQQNVPGWLNDVVAIATGDNGSFALLSTGRVVAWGYEFYGLLSGAAALSDVIDIAAGDVHAVALHADGSTTVWGAENAVEYAPHVSGAKVKAIFAGGRRTHYLLEDGSVARAVNGWLPHGLTDVLALASGRGHELALVGYEFQYSGFGEPVDDDVVNEVRAGRSVPLKFSLGAYRGLGILAMGSPSSQAVTCDTDAVVDAVETTNTAGANVLRYDETTDEYVYVWKTERDWKGTCRTLTLALVDGSKHQETFLFR